jgi:hypothetical protein
MSHRRRHDRKGRRDHGYDYGHENDQDEEEDHRRQSQWSPGTQQSYAYDDSSDPFYEAPDTTSYATASRSAVVEVPAKEKKDPMRDKRKKPKPPPKPGKKPDTQDPESKEPKGKAPEGTTPPLQHVRPFSVLQYDYGHTDSTDSSQMLGGVGTWFNPESGAASTGIPQYQESYEFDQTQALASELSGTVPDDTV